LKVFSFPLARLAARLRAHELFDAFLIGASSAIIDGEVVAPGAGGTTDFSVLQK
jgi:ATP-dependent DNA ligase